MLRRGTNSTINRNLYTGMPLLNKGCISMKSTDTTPRSKFHLRGFLRKLPLAIVLLIIVLVLNAGVMTGVAVDHEARTNPQFCATCHNMETHVDSYLEEETHLANAHYQAGVGCKDCHADYSIVDELTSLVDYVTGNYYAEPIRRRMDDDMCLGCHISMEHQAERTDFITRNPHQSHFDLGCQDCHLGHDDQIDYCSSCHENGGQRMLGDEAVARGVISGVLGDGGMPDFSNAPTSQ